jgi:ribose-phosphate pyrophosphokinase
MLSIISGAAHPALARDIAAVLNRGLVPVDLARYPDAEVVRIRESVRGSDVYIVQSTPPPSEGHLFELVLLADAAHRAGAAHVTAVVPYLSYMRQDRRAGGERTAIGARVVADMLGGGRIGRLVTVDLHQPAVEAFFDMPVEHLEAFPLFEAALQDVPRDSVVVAPDLGAARLADRLSKALGLPFAVVHKTRTSGVEVEATGVTGEVRGRRPIVVDDMITTGRTLQAALEAVTQAGAAGEAVVAATHAILAPGAPELLASLPVARLLMTDSVPTDAAAGLRGFRPVPLARLLADAVERLHEGRSLAWTRSQR